MTTLLDLIYNSGRYVPTMAMQQYHCGAAWQAIVGAAAMLAGTVLLNLFVIVLLVEVSNAASVTSVDMVV